MRNSTIARPLSCRFQGKLPTGPALPPSERLRAFATPCELFATRGCEPSPTDFVGVAMNTAAWRRTSRRNYAALTIAALAGTVGFPLKYGYAAVGQVVAVGAQVAPEWQDRLVFSFHPHESHFLASLAELMPVPSGVPPETAAFLPNMETAVNFLMDGQPLIGEQVVIFGQGVVGLLTTALLARLPLAGLITLDRYTLRRETSLALGAHASLDPAEPQVLMRLRALLQQDQQGADQEHDR